MYDVTQIHTEMQKRGWTVTKLAKRAKVPQSTASQLFARGSGHPDNIKKLAKAVDLDLENLVVVEEKQSRKTA